MTKLRILNMRTGEDMGTYEAVDDADALSQMATRHGMPLTVFKLDPTDDVGEYFVFEDDP